MPHATLPRILFIDAYDSFTNNIISLLETQLSVSVTVIKIDNPIANFTEFLRPFSAVVAGPGPGDPRKSEDVGWVSELWKLRDEDLIPVLGICLGFQSLVLAFGGEIERLPEPRHGVVRKVRGSGDSIFRDVENVESVQYHSLHASLGSLSATDEVDLWSPFSCCGALRPLAWDFGDDSSVPGSLKSLGKSLGPILMAVEHNRKPFFGVQFHAESICSNQDARNIILEWWDSALDWNRQHSKFKRAPRSFPLVPWEEEIKPHMFQETAAKLRPRKLLKSHGSSRKALKTSRENSNGNSGSQGSFDRTNSRGYVSNKDVYGIKPKLEVITRVLDVGKLTTPSICEILDLNQGKSIILDSESHQRSEVGEYSIIGAITSDNLRLDYCNEKSEVCQVCKEGARTISLEDYDGSIFVFLRSFVEKHRAKSSYTNVPFWGGLMGYVNYEAGLETINSNRNQCQSLKNHDGRPDLSFIFVERSIVIDHFNHKIYIQSIKPHDEQWVEDATSQLQHNDGTAFKQCSQFALPRFSPKIALPNERVYKSQVRDCQDAIRAGDSYELCLTTQATIKTSIVLPSWPLYLRLRKLNPAPFSAYIRLGKMTLLSSSPERFLCWSRPSRDQKRSTIGFEADKKISVCQFRPIKGTVKRQPDPNRLPLTLAEATALLSTPKERAENLMIVDLIRHDLHSVVGSGRVSVPKLMVVEEYATLFQLVSVVEGSLIIDDSDEEDDVLHPRVTDRRFDKTETTFQDASHKTAPSGIDVLASSLPPGSMTGAPKLRSCQILRSLENRKRGIYSGVVGYMDVGGGGDFCVVIRSAVRWDDGAPKDVDYEDVSHSEDPQAGEEEEVEGNEERGNTWTIGAGGAVTSLSTEDGEWEEMVAKLTSTLRLFESDE